MSNQKKSKAVPVVIILTVLMAALCVGCFFADDAIRSYHDDKLAKEQAAVEARNIEADQEYAAALARFQAETVSGANLAWPDHANEGWDIIDLTTYPLESPYTQTMYRSDIMNNGMLLVNQWHSRPDLFDETLISSIGKYTGGKIQVQDYNVMLFPVAIEALQAALADAETEGLTHYMVSEGYRTWDTQNNYFQNKVKKLESKYEDEEELIAAAKKEVNYPGTSEFNSGMSFTLRLYDKTDASVGSPKYSTTAQGKWMNENCWKYGLIFRFPLADWPLEGTADKSFKTGISTELNLYRYVGTGHATVMHILDLCMEEYIEYLEEHNHIAVFENGKLKYEIVRQYVGDADPFTVNLTGKANNFVSSLDNMGGVITVFEY